jgi:IS1 family transposase
VGDYPTDHNYALLDQIQSGEVTVAEAAVRLQRPHRWVWVAMDPVSKLLVAVVVGDRSLAMAQTLVHAVVRVLAPGVVPLFLTDGLRHYATALVTHFGQWVAVPPRCEQGPKPKPRWLPIPELLYAQVKKRRRRKRVVGISQQVIFGAPERIKAILAQSGWQINTAFVERLNLAFRGHLAALARRAIGRAKSEAGLIRQAQLWRAYYNFCLPHSALRLQLPEPVPTRGSGSPKKWQHCTPAMAAGLTSQLWTVQQLLLFRVPPWRQEVAL